MADYIALVIVFGGLNQDNGQAFARDSLCEGLPSHGVEYSHIVRINQQLDYTGGAPSELGLLWKTGSWVDWIFSISPTMDFPAASNAT